MVAIEGGRCIGCIPGSTSSLEAESLSGGVPRLSCVARGSAVGLGMDKVVGNDFAVSGAGLRPGDQAWYQALHGVGRWRGPSGLCIAGSAGVGAASTVGVRGSGGVGFGMGRSFAVGASAGGLGVPGGGELLGGG